MVNFFRRKKEEEDPRIAEAKQKATAELKEHRVQERVANENYRVLRAKQESDSKLERRIAHDQKYDEERKTAAVAKAAEKARSDAATVGMAPGTAALSRVVNTVRKLQGPGPRPETVVKETRVENGRTVEIVKRYPGSPGGRSGGGARSIPAFQFPSGGASRSSARPAPKTRTIVVKTAEGYEERKIPVKPAAPAPRRSSGAFSIPAFEGGGGFGTSAALSGGNSVVLPATITGGAPKGKKGKTGIPFLDSQ